MARAHHLVARMSEDVDFKVVPTDTSISNNQRRQALGNLRDRISATLIAAGFTLAEEPRSRDANQDTVLQLRTGTAEGEGSPLRATIQIELSFARLRESTVMRSVASFVTQAFKRKPELDQVECTSLTETAAEKAVSLTRRTAMEIAGVGRAPDPTLVRHIYDLNMLREHVDLAKVARLMRDIAAMDADQFGRQHPAYADDIAGETRKALKFLSADATVRARYDNFVAAMVYGKQVPFDEALQTIVDLVAAAWPSAI